MYTVFNSLQDKHCFKLFSIRFRLVCCFNMGWRKVTFICCEIRHSITAIQAVKNRDGGKRVVAYQSETVLKEAAA